MSRSAWRLSALICTLVVLIHCAGCSDSPTGQLSSPETVVTTDVADLSVAEAIFDVDTGDLSAIELEPVESLHVKFMVPASSITSNSGTSEKPFVKLSGKVLGEFDSFYIRTDYQEEPILVDVAESGDFDEQVHLRPPVDTGTVLEAQPTTVWAVAQSANGRRAYDVVVVVSNPGFPFPSPLQLTPDVLFAHEPNELLFTLDLNNANNFLTDQVWVMEVEADCKTKVSGSARQLEDDGQIDVNGDQLAVDKVYSVYVKLNDLEPGTHFFRAAITTAQAEKPLVAYSACLPVRVVDHISGASCAAARDILLEARTTLDDSLATGWPLADARRKAVANLMAEPAVAEVGAAEFGDQVWVRFSSGILGAVHPTDYTPTSSMALFHADGTPPTVPQEPLSRQVISLLVNNEEPHPWQETIENSTCPPWRDLTSSGQAKLARRLFEAGLFFVAGRGGPVFGGLSDEGRQAIDSSAMEFDAPPPAWTGWDHAGTQEVFWLEDDWSCDDLASAYQTCKFFADGKCLQNGSQQVCAPDKECIITHGNDATPSGVLFDRTQADLATGRLVLGADGLGMTPSFVARYSAGGLEGQFAWLGFPYSGKSVSMALELLAAGVNGIVATPLDVDPVAAEKAGTTFFEYALAEDLSPGAIMPPLGAGFSDHQWRLLGPGSIILNFSGLINPEFATGDLRGWVREGDARVLLDWCDAGPATKHMAVVSNGLSYAIERGEISQEFCLSTDKLVFEAYYNFISHEFLDECGSDFYEDRLELYIEDGTGQRVSLAVTEKHDYIGINALCPCEAGNCGLCEQCGSAACDCGELYDPGANEELSLWPEECRFDSISMGDAFSSGWRHTGEVALTNLGQGGFNKPVRMVLRVSDESGTKGNTAVLVDSLILK
jgi:hypothetical protein